jgi:hypothetical protein
MTDRQELILNFLVLFRRLFSFLGQTNPRYFQVFLHCKIGPRYLSLPKILLSTVVIALIAPALRFFVPPVTYWPLYLLPFAPTPHIDYIQRGTFSILPQDLLPFWIFAIAFLITAVRRHLDGERRIIEGEPLHSFDRGDSRWFDPEAKASYSIKEPLLILACGAGFAYAALLTGAFHPAFGSFLIVGAFDYAITYGLMSRYWTVALQDQLDAELEAANFEEAREAALGGRPGPFGGGTGPEEPPSPFNR